MSNSLTIRIGTRASALARWQAEWVAGQLASAEVRVELVFISTQGDTKSGPIGAIGAPGVFTKELQRALLDGRVDLAVHSLKDLPTDEAPGLSLAAVPPRENCGDVLVSNDFASLDALPECARVGTGSARRRSQLLFARGDLDVRDIRGNLDTRLTKLDAGDYDAIVLAEAGLMRLGLRERITCVLSKDVMLPAIGQGALGLECRTDDAATQAAIGPLNDAAAHACVTAERTLLAALRGGCLAPIGAWCRVEGGRMEEGELVLNAVVLDLEGRRRILAHDRADLGAAKEIGQSVAQKLLGDGAGELIERSRRSG